jgi:uncharacterized membrane protein
MSRKKLLILLFASVAVNLFAIGAVVGGLTIARHPHRGDAQAMRPGPALWAAAEHLEPEQRQAFRHLLREQGRETGGHVRAARQARREAWSHMAEEPFDPDRINRELELARRVEMEARGAAEQRMVAFAGSLPAAERARFAEGLARAAPEGPSQGRRRMGMAEPPPPPEGRPD